MYKIKKVKLKNFQLHSNLELDFSGNLDVITGLTSTGKSGIFKAIYWLYGFSNVSENDYRKENTDETSVTVLLSSGFEIERIRSNSLNRYILRKENCEEKVFDKCGKDVPEEIKIVLGIQELEFDKINLNVNFASQDDLNFIFDSKIPASFNAKLFNKLTGNELLDTLFQSCNKESLSISKEIKRLDEEIKKQKEESENCEKAYIDMHKKFGSAVEIYTQIEEKIIIYDELKKLASKLKENKETQDFVKYKLDKIVIISDDTIKQLKEKSEKFKELISIQNKLKEVKVNLDKTIKSQKELKIPQIDFEKLKEKAIMYNELEQLFATIEQNKNSQEKVILQLKDIKEKSVKLDKELKEVWKQLDFCEKCKPTAEKIIFGR